MPVTELSTLKFTSPTSSWDTFRTLFREVSEKQSQWSGYPLMYFAEEPIIYLISGWESVEAHNGWIASDANQKLLKEFGPHLTIEDFVHLKMDPERIPADTRAITVEKLSDAETARDHGVSIVAEAEEVKGMFYRLTTGKGARRVYVD